jgi:uncharacterized protein YjbJ (UPF0337 family)
MGKTQAKAKQVKGRLRETTGRIVGDRHMVNKGRAEKVGGKVQEVVEGVKKSIRH